VNIVTLADLLVRELHLGYSGNYAFTVPKQALNGGRGRQRQQVSDAILRLVDHIEPRAKALGLGQATTGELYQQALAQANKELGRVSGQLAEQEPQADGACEVLRRAQLVQGELSSGRAATDGSSRRRADGHHRAGGEHGCDVLAAAGPEFAETILCNAQGDVFQTALVGPAGGHGRRAGVGRAAGGWVASARGFRSQVASARRTLVTAGDDGGEELEWLVSVISPRLPQSGRYWDLPEADGACIGGIVWGGEPGEAQRLSPQVEELSAIANGWSLALRTAQIREEARNAFRAVGRGEPSAPQRPERDHAQPDDDLDRRDGRRRGA